MSFMGFNIINGFSTYIFVGTDDLEVGGNISNNLAVEIRILNLCIGVVKLIGAIFGTFFADNIGRRRTLIYGNGAVIFMLLGFYIFGLENFGLGE